MIKIVADNFVKKDEVNEFLSLAKTLIAETRKEKGCISYNLNRDLKDETHLTFIEEWEDEKAIEGHNSSDHFTTCVPEMAKHCSKPGTCCLYTEVDL